MALAQGVENGNLRQVIDALKEGADPDEVIEMACEKGNLDIVRELLKNGADPDIRSWKWHTTPLHRACVFGHASIVEELLKYHANVHIRSMNCWMTPLENAIDFGHFACVKLLVEAGAKVNDINRSFGSTPLIMACGKGFYEIVQLLLDSGADPHLCVNVYSIYAAVQFPQIIQLLLDRGADVNCVNHTQLSVEQPLHKASYLGCVESVRLLLRAGANPMTKNTQQETPINLAKWQLNYHQTTPCNPPDVTEQIIKNLKDVINFL